MVRQNSYAASTVTVEAGQPVISTGLYAIVRYPIYSAALVMTAFTYWGVLMIIPIVATLAWRLLDEECVLKRDLLGYVDYCRRVRFRLIPSIW